MNKQISNQKMYNTGTLHKTVTVDGLSIFYRESGDPANPKMVLLHGFPSSSHQYRNLMSTLADHFHVVAPDYPGFGNSDLPSPDEFNYTFDRFSEIIEDFLKVIGFTHFGLYMQDYGGPVGFRIITRHPEWLKWLVIQNTNAYEIGFTNFGKTALLKLRPHYTGFYNLTQLDKYICTVTKILEPSVQTIGTWILGSWNAQIHGACRWICSMTTALM